MSFSRPLWWNTLLPWRALGCHLPVATTDKRQVTGLVVHRQGRYGWNQGNWVDGDPSGWAVHYGLDVIGWLNKSEPHRLDGKSICCSPADGVVAWVGADEHGQASMNLRHSSRTAERRRFSFFGDLQDVYVKAGQRVSAGTPLGRPNPFRQGWRFFHFGMGYEIRRGGKWQDVFINPGPLLPGNIITRRELPWKTD